MEKEIKIPMQPAYTWWWDEEAWEWKPPVPYPTEQGIYKWNDWDRVWIRLGDSSTYKGNCI